MSRRTAALVIALGVGIPAALPAAAVAPTVFKCVGGAVTSKYCVDTEAGHDQCVVTEYRRTPNGTGTYCHFRNP